MRFLIIFIFLLSNAFANDVSKIKNLAISKEPKTYDILAFLDTKNNIIELSEFKGKLVILNFWATWCAPCKEEMPSLSELKKNPNLDNLVIFPINVGQDGINQSQKFLVDLKIDNLEIFFDNSNSLAKKLSLRGLPTTIIFNKKGKEFARVVGSINFSDPIFIEWLSSFN
ncbi:TlpA family protein disulfide reductase [Candidatus Pelagibacter sp.]|nr:TlpA family protein disulfide reductase [Candidatus Pelagibacter sp.]|tara:strand:+ start:25 stop:534 length:510 start_codon:yes stop_codon:yes gene_type:complete